MTIGYRQIAALAGAGLLATGPFRLPSGLAAAREAFEPSAEISKRPAVLPPFTESDRLWVRATAAGAAASGSQWRNPNRRSPLW